MFVGHWGTPQKCPFTLRFARLNLAIAGCPLGHPAKMSIYSDFDRLIFWIAGCPCRCGLLGAAAELHARFMITHRPTNTTNVL
jgi:hypothetical protein